MRSDYPSTRTFCASSRKARDARHRNGVDSTHEDLQTKHSEALTESSRLQHRVESLEVNLDELRETAEAGRCQLQLLANSLRYVSLFKATGNSIAERVLALRDMRVEVIDSLKPSVVIKGFSMLMREFTDSEQGQGLLKVLQQSRGSAIKFHKQLGKIVSDITALWEAGRPQYEEDRVSVISSGLFTICTFDIGSPRQKSNEAVGSSSSRSGSRDKSEETFEKRSLEALPLCRERRNTRSNNQKQKSPRNIFP